MVDIVHRVGVKAPLAEVHNALTTTEGLSRWWTRDVSGVPEPGKEILFNFNFYNGDHGSFRMKVLKQTPELVAWRVVDGPAEWIGTDVTFKLSQQDDYTVVLFAHRNWKEEVEFTAHCSTRWASFLFSLKDLVEERGGRPAPDDQRVGNWN